MGSAAHQALIARVPPDEQRLLDVMVREAVGAWKAALAAVLAEATASYDLGPARRAVLERMGLGEPPRSVPYT
jgi:hypothetical protein